MVAQEGVRALPAALIAVPLSPPADGAVSRPPSPPPPPPPPSPPVLVAPAAVAAALRVAASRVEAAQAAVDAPLPADGGGPLGLDVVGGAPAAAAAAAAAAGGAAAGARPAALATTAGVRSRLFADDASTPVSGVFSRARCLWDVAAAGPPPVAVGGGGGGGGGGSPAPFRSDLPLPAALVALLPPAATPPADWSQWRARRSARSPSF